MNEKGGQSGAGRGEGVERESALGAADLAELMGEFNLVTARLHESHAALQRDVARLQGELDQAHERLHRSRRLAALGEMAAGIAHEVRNPLGAIALNARLIERGEESEEQARVLGGWIGEAVRGLDLVVRDVLSFARDLRPRLERVCAQTLVDRVLEVACAGELMGGVTVEVDRAGLGRLELACDPLMMARAMVNIVRNGLEAMADAEEPRVLRIDARIDARGDAERGGIVFSDSGDGIDEQTLDRMFNPFFTTRASGTGLGLAIVHRIVDAHEGEIDVRTRDRAVLGRGTSFEIMLGLWREHARDGSGVDSECTPITVVKAGLEHAA